MAAVARLVTLVDVLDWAYLTGILRQQGVVADALELTQLPHDVVLSERLLARVGRNPGDAVSR